MLRVTTVKRCSSAVAAIIASIGNLEANRVLKRMDDKAYKTAVARMNDEADRLKTEITNLRLKLRGEAEKKQWVDWVDHFGKEIDEKIKLTD